MSKAPRTCCWCKRSFDETPLHIVAVLAWGSRLGYHAECWNQLQEHIDRNQGKVEQL